MTYAKWLHPQGRRRHASVLLRGASSPSSVSRQSRAILCGLEAWGTYANVVGAAAAALVGLLFVAVSIRVDAINASGELRNRAAQTLGLFLTVRVPGSLGVADVRVAACLQRPTSQLTRKGTPADEKGKSAMSIDPDVFFDVLGGEQAAAAMSDEAKADALEHYLIESLNDTAYLDSPGYVEEQATFLQSSTPVTRRGTGAIFGDGHRDPPPWHRCRSGPPWWTSSCSG
jgi:hypothetical protein